jgi:hypothetical protein
VIYNFIYETSVLKLPINRQDNPAERFPACKVSISKVLVDLNEDPEILLSYQLGLQSRQKTVNGLKRFGGKPKNSIFFIVALDSEDQAGRCLREQ